MVRERKTNKISPIYNKISNFQLMVRGLIWYCETVFLGGQIILKIKNILPLKKNKSET